MDIKTWRKNKMKERERLQNIISKSEEKIKDIEFKIKSIEEDVELRKRLFKEDEKYIEEYKNEIEEQQIIIDMIQKELKRENDEEK